MKKISFYTLLLLPLLLFNECSSSWQKALTKGEIQEDVFSRKIDLELTIGIIIMPVKINGKDYRFLFDTGAPTSISKKLQEEFSFKIISKGNTIDSDKNRKKVKYVEVDSILLGDIPFIDQTAFVGDFEANPILKCLNIDGIIGSNLIRFCNWTIDYQKEAIFITNQNLDLDTSDYEVISFSTNAQFGIKTDLKLENATLTNMTIDYGSNGSLSISKSVYSTLKEKNVITKSFERSGLTQSGITGVIKKNKSEIAFIESASFGDLTFNNIEVNSNGSGLIGSKILSRAVIHIDWSDMLLYISKEVSNSENSAGYGFYIGQSADQSLYVQSTIKGSAAYDVGMVNNMKILEIDSLDFTSTATYCDYINYTNPSDSLSIKVMDDEGEISTFSIIKRELK